MDYSKGDIVLVNFNPQKKAEEVGKTRPAVVVSKSELNLVLDLITVVPLTTNLIDNAEPLRVRVTAKENLKEDSDAMVEQLRAVSKSRVMQKVATLSSEELVKIDAGIVAMLGL